MKRLIASIAAVVVVQFFSPIIPAHAASLNEQLVQLASQQASADRIQQLLTLKNQWEQGNTQQLVETLAKAAVKQSGQINTGSNVLEQIDVNQTVQNALRQQMGQTITDKVTPYEKELTAIATFFNNQFLAPKAASESNSLTAAPKAASENNSLTAAPKNYKKVLNMTSTAYAPGTLDNGKWDTKTYVGSTVRPGVAAVDPRVIPMGTKLWVEGYGEAIADDQGSAIKGNRIDLVFNDRQEALDYGIKKVKVYVLS
jgi:3D (Asp-Asp-Asp) domain-containing protein